MTDNVVGQKIGKYQIVRRLGRGGMAEVYLAQDTVMRRPVALKLMAEHLTRDPQFIARFYEEARAMANLPHPHIVTVYEIDQVAGRPYIAMAYLEGHTLAELPRGDGAWPALRVAGITAQIAEALDYAHAHGLLHRDIKPANIVVSAHDRATLTNFGLVKAVEGTSFTRTGTLLGTPTYMSPEQIADRPIGPASDIYSLGVVAYELLAGRVPFQAETTLALMQKVAQEAPPPLHKLNRRVPSAVASVIHKALEKNPARRYRTAGDFARDLERAAHRPQGAGLGQAGRRRGAILGVAGLAVVVMLGR